MSYEKSARTRLQHNKIISFCLVRERTRRLCADYFVYYVITITAVVAVDIIITTMIRDGKYNCTPNIDRNVREVNIDFRANPLPSTV